MMCVEARPISYAPFFRWQPADGPVDYIDIAVMLILHILSSQMQVSENFCIWAPHQ